MSVQQPTVGDLVTATFAGRTAVGEVSEIRTEASISATGREYVIDTGSGATIVVPEDNVFK